MNEPATPLLEVRELKKYFPVTSYMGRIKHYVHAVDNISFTLNSRETFGLVGETGCGKTTAGRTLMRIVEPTSGSAFYKGKDIFKMSAKAFRKVRKDIAMIFQDPYSSLNPKQRVGSIIEEPMEIHNLYDQKVRAEKALELLYQVGLDEEQFFRFPHEFSGGQRQRIGIARTLAVNPEIIICDEPVSALDVSIQSQVINLLEELQDQFNLGYIFIAHDLSVVRHISDYIGVMYLGRLVEQAETDELFANPLHPYTRALLSAIPVPNPFYKKTRIKLTGALPSQQNLPEGCSFSTRCPHVIEKCKSEVPEYLEVSPRHLVSCHLI